MATVGSKLGVSVWWSLLVGAGMRVERCGVCYQDGSLTQFQDSTQMDGWRVGCNRNGVSSGSARAANGLREERTMKVHMWSFEVVIRMHAHSAIFVHPKAS